MLLVFDLDFTLWDAGGTWCDHTSPPYLRQMDHIIDSEGRVIALYPDVPGILSALKEKNIDMAIASRTYSPGVAKELLDLFKLREYFLFEEIYPSSKIRHFEQLHRHSGIPYNEMFFFDDEYRNIAEVESLGVNARLVSKGLSNLEIQGIPELEGLV